MRRQQSNDQRHGEKVGDGSQGTTAYSTYTTNHVVALHRIIIIMLAWVSLLYNCLSRLQTL